MKGQLNKLTNDMLITNTKVYNVYKQVRMYNGWDGGWQKENFTVMLKLSELSGKTFKGTSCLDVGCGTGDFSKVLRKRSIKTYVGIDIYSPAIEEAKAKYPNEIFILGDILAGDIKETCNFAFCSGALTTKHFNFDNYNYFASMVQKMWELTSTGIVFNYLTTEDDGYEDPDLFCYETEKVLQLCTEIAPNANLLAEPTPGKSQMHIFMWR